MASSDYDTYGNLKIKSVLLDAPSGLVFHDPADDSKKCTLKITSGLGVGNVDVELPTSAGALLNAGSDLDAAKMTGIQTLAQPGVADADVFLYADADDSNNPKSVAASALKTYINAGTTELPSGTNDQILCHNGADWVACTVAGDITHAGGSLTINNDAVDAAALANDAVDSAAIAIGAIDNANKFGVGAVDANALATDAVVEAKIQNNAVTMAKMADAPSTYGTAEASKLLAADANKDVASLRHVTAEGTVEAGSAEAFRLGGDTDGSFRIRISSGNLVFEKKETGTWVQKGSFVA